MAKKVLKKTGKFVLRRILKMTKILAIFIAIITFLSVMVDKVLKTPANGELETTTIVEAVEDTITGSGNTTVYSSDVSTNKQEEFTAFTLSQIPEFSGDAYVVVNNGIPYFEASEITTSVFETYSELDALDRCGVAYANICKELMPTEDREKIGSVKPSGWTYNGKSNNNKYDFVDGKYIYNRCHLIGFQLAGENANKKNLITGTRYLNIEGMLPFENMVADYVKETNNHVLYRVTPIYKDNELAARGVLMEGYSVEDNGRGVKFCVFAYNVQPGVIINYSTGQNQPAS